MDNFSEKVKKHLPELKKLQRELHEKQLKEQQKEWQREERRAQQRKQWEEMNKDYLRRR